MHGLYNLNDMLVHELSEYGERNELNTNALPIIDTLAHAAKNLEKVIEHCEDEDRDEMRGSYRRMYDGGSYARGRRYPKRDRMGRYSTERGYSRDAGELTDKLREMMTEAPDDMTRHEIERLVEKMEHM